MVAIAIALYLCWLMLRPFVGVLEWATVLVIVFYPVHKLLAKRIKRRGIVGNRERNLSPLFINTDIKCIPHNSLLSTTACYQREGLIEVCFPMCFGGQGRVTRKRVKAQPT